MKATFHFDGDQLRIYIKTEDGCETALAKVMERYNRATVSLDYGESSMYSYRDQEPKGVRIILRESPKCPHHGGACVNHCYFADGEGNGCKIMAAHIKAAEPTGSLPT